MRKNTLLLSSKFYSIQGEGISTGIPSYFLRLKNCNITCGMSRLYANQLRKENTLQDGEIFRGDLEEEGLATWTCDSTSQWLLRGEETPFQEIVNDWKELGIYDSIRNGYVHLIWTGGEPMLHINAIDDFISYLSVIDDFDGLYNEIETNGTLWDDRNINCFNQINCSPKLSNSGMTVKQRIKPDVINSIIKGRRDYQFKFVISTELDIKEMFDTFITPFEIPLKNVVCMPGLDSQRDFNERTKWVLEMAKKYKFRGMTRLHIAAWDKTLNV